tara:strand:+ start:1093 stop:1992 length:900 start_codon:yes stop_codon:yes gene_type:complete
MFDQVSIIGCGLIGSSIFKGLKKVGSIKKIISYDKDKTVTEIIKNEKLSDEIFNSAGDAVKDSDLVIIATPISSFESVLNSMKDNLKTGSIVTDTCSVKTGVAKIFKKFNLKNSICIPGHPVAGIENSGPKAGVSDLFKNRWTILTPGKGIDEKAIKKLSSFWELMGSKVKIMSDEDHDKILSFTSHLPHAIAYNIVQTSMSNDEETKEDIIRYSAGGLRDFTRIAASDPIMWRDIFIDNSALIIKAIDKFIKNLDQFKKAISDKDSKKLLEIFEKSKDFRKSVIEAGQDTDKPDFGRK